MNYRRDIRTEEQFQEDILRDTKIEAEIALSLCVYHFQKHHTWPTLVANGTDATGKYIQNDEQITSAPDFLIDGIPTEIMHSKFSCKWFFHIKEHKLRSCIENGVQLIMVNSIMSKYAEFCRINQAKGKVLREWSLERYGTILKHPTASGGMSVAKPAYQIDNAWVKWYTLPELIDLPDSYKEICQIAYGAP